MAKIKFKILFCFSVTMSYLSLTEGVSFIKYQIASAENTVQTRTTFKPEIQDKMCLLIPEKGPCRGDIVMYFFEPESMGCKTFEWGGCQGNGNRFDSESECKRTCLRTRAKKGQPRYCKLTFDYGWCFGSEYRYYYDFRWKVCKKTLYSGCGGNRNNFHSFEQCEQVCRFGLEPLKTVRGKDNTNREVNKYLIINPLDAKTPPSTARATRSSTIIRFIYTNKDVDENEIETVTETKDQATGATETTAAA